LGIAASRDDFSGGAPFRLRLGRVALDRSNAIRAGWPVPATGAFSTPGRMQSRDTAD